MSAEKTNLQSKSLAFIRVPTWAPKRYNVQQSIEQKHPEGQEEKANVNDLTRT